MRDISFFTKIYIAVNPADFRKQANGLLLVVKGHLEKHPFEPKSLFVFTNKRRTGIRMLYWDQTGFALWSKTLEKDKFKWPKDADCHHVQLHSRDLKWLLQGIDLRKMKSHDHLKYDEIS